MFLSVSKVGVEGNQLKDSCGTESKVAGDANQEMRSDYRRADNVHVKESASQKSPMETICSDSNNSIPVVSHLQVVGPFQNSIMVKVLGS